MDKQLVHHIASRLAAYRSCQARTYTTGVNLWARKHQAAIDWLVREYMPSGSGLDAGTKLDYDRSNPDRLVFTTSFHHMNDAGMYDGWTDHTITVKPSFVYGLDIGISGRDRNDIKDYLADTYRHALEHVVDDAQEALASVVSAA